MAIEDMFLKVDGVTGEAGDADHKGEIEVLSWSWGMDATVSSATGKATGKTRMGELVIVKRVDLSSATLMMFCDTRKPFKAKLTVRKAGSKPLEYVFIEVEDALIVSIKVGSEGTELVERLHLAYVKVKLNYVPQDATGARGGGTRVFEKTAADTGG